MRQSAIIFMVLLCLGSPIMAETFNVPADVASIGAALDMAQAGDLVLVACGFYFEHDLVMKSGVTLASNTAGAYCATIDAQGLGRVIVCNDVDATASISGFTIKGGSSAAEGGGIYLNNSSPTIENCIIKNNSALTGGGMACVNGSSPRISWSNFTSNSSDAAGGGISLDASAPEFYDCIVDNNLAGDVGGGIRAFDSSFSLTHSNINENNSLGSGAGIRLSGGSDAALSLVTIFGNYAGDNGGGIEIDSSAPTITSCSIVENACSGSGAGLAIHAASNVGLQKTIISFNTMAEGLWLAGGDVTITCSDIFGNGDGGAASNWTPEIEGQLASGNNLDSDPQFCGSNSSGNYYLQNDSPCASSGPGNLCGVLIGSRIVDCGEIATQPSDWGVIKSMY